MLNRQISKLQNRYFITKKTLNNLNNSLFFQKDYLISMINNVSEMNNLKLYQDVDYLFISILDELKLIKNEIDSCITIITFKHIYKNTLSFYIKKNNKINELLLKYSNHIAPENINYILKLFIGKKWTNNFSHEELEKIFFLMRFLKPISIWDSEHHKIEIQYYNPNKFEESGMKRSNSMTKDIIDSLLGIRPGFLKTLNDLTISSPKKETNKKTNNFCKNECNKILLNNNIHITKNQQTSILLEDKNGLNVYIRNKDKFIVIQGLIKDDLINFSENIGFVKDYITKHKELLYTELTNVPKYFKDNFLKILSLRDTIACLSSEIIEDVKKKFNDFKTIQGKPLLSLINEFLLASKYRKIDILSLLLMSNEDDNKLAFILFDVFKTKDKKNISTEIYQSLHHSIRVMLDITKNNIEHEDSELSKLVESDIPYERRIALLKTSDDVKVKALEKLKAIKTNFQGDSKAQSWLDGLLKIPFGIYSKNEIINFKEDFIQKIQLNSNEKIFSDNDVDNYIKTITDNSIINEWSNYKINKKEYLKKVRNTLDNAVYGHKEAKIQLERLFAQWINGESGGAVLGLQGPPGTGKTSFVKNGLSKCLCDITGKPRPFVFLPIGGSVNGSTLVGHNFTYVGSTWGRIADILMVTNCMNPIIFIDEIDKVSQTEHGREIISILTHLTDSTQNDEFEDKFFSGIKLDLSKALIVFSFNDPNLIDPILKDRITIIETNPLSLQEKITIIRDYMFPEICKEVGFNKNEILLSDETITFLIETYTNEAGVRKIKEKIVEIIRDINLNRFFSDEFQLPYTVKNEYVKILFENKPKVRVKKIATQPGIGLVNGLYATSSGLGGLTIIQLTRFPSDKMLDLQLTGKAGDVMKESVQYSLKVAWGLLSNEEQDKIIEDSHNKKAYGIHIHCPDGATPKDGPSAGAAFALAIYSILTNKKINNKMCMTGEIDLLGNITAIGGLESKLQGGKKAGCTFALVPEENWEDIERMRREKLSPEDESFIIYPVKTIQDVIKYAIVQSTP